VIRWRCSFAEPTFRVFESVKKILRRLFLPISAFAFILAKRIDCCFPVRERVSRRAKLPKSFFIPSAFGNIAGAIGKRVKAKRPGAASVGAPLVIRDPDLPTCAKA